MPILGADGSMIRRLSSPGAAAKAWAQLAQDSFARPAPEDFASSVRAR